MRANTYISLLAYISSILNWGEVVFLKLLKPDAYFAQTEKLLADCDKNLHRMHVNQSQVKQQL